MDNIINKYKTNPVYYTIVIVVGSVFYFYKNENVLSSMIICGLGLILYSQLIIQITLLEKELAIVCPFRLKYRYTLNWTEIKSFELTSTIRGFYRAQIQLNDDSLQTEKKINLQFDLPLGDAKKLRLAIQEKLKGDTNTLVDTI